MCDDYTASTDSIFYMSEIFVSVTQADNMDAAPVISGQNCTV